MAEDAGSVLEGYFIDFQLGCNVFFFFFSTSTFQPVLSAMDGKKA